MSRRNKIILSAVVMVALLLAVGFFFLRPVPFAQMLSVCNKEGETLSVEFDVTMHRHLFRATEMRGTITIGETAYVSAKDIYGDNFTGSSFLFHVPTGYAIDNWDNTIIVDLYEDNFDCFSFYLIKSGEGDAYYGPAASLTELEDVLKKISSSP